MRTKDSNNDHPVIDGTRVGQKPGLFKKQKGKDTNNKKNVN